MDSMMLRWQKAMQATEDIRNSQLAASRKEQPSKILKQVTILTQSRDPKASISLEEKAKDSRTRSNDRKAASRENRLVSGGKKVETPIKQRQKRGAKKEKILENSTNAIIQLFAPMNPDKYRLALKSLLQNFLLQSGLEKPEVQRSALGESTAFRPVERAFGELEAKYLESQRERQYLRGKLQMSAKRSQGLQRQIERYSKVEKLIDQSISREAELKQELSRAHLQRTLLEQTMRQQREIYERQVTTIRELIQSLKISLPNGN